MNNSFYLKYPSIDAEQAWLEYTNEYFDKNSDSVVSGYKKNDNYKEWL